MRPSTLETFGELLGASQDEPDLDLEKVLGLSLTEFPVRYVCYRTSYRFTHFYNLWVSFHLGS